MSKILLLVGVLIILSFAACGQSVTPEIDNPTKPISTMTDSELKQMIDKHTQKMASGLWTTQISASGIAALVYQNELILRHLQSQQSKEER